MTFEAHGEYELFMIGEIVITRFFNTWNMEGAQKFFEEYKNVIHKSNLKKFGVLSDLSRFEGGTPDAMDFFSEVAEWAFNNGQIARAMILDSGYKTYTIDRIDKGRMRFPMETFDDEAEAVRWLVDLGLSDS